MNAIAAMALNRVIGKGNKIPWHLPEDFKWFKKTTMGHPILMDAKHLNRSESRCQAVEIWW